MVGALVHDSVGLFLLFLLACSFCDGLAHAFAVRVGWVGGTGVTVECGHMCVSLRVFVDFVWLQDVVGEYNEFVPVCLYFSLMCG
jgi:hypothetical protein